MVINVIYLHQEGLKQEHMVKSSYCRNRSPTGDIVNCQYLDKVWCPKSCNYSIQMEKYKDTRSEEGMYEGVGGMDEETVKRLKNEH
jgi:hypothetical protein